MENSRVSEEGREDRYVILGFLAFIAMDIVLLLLR
jgi:hypothetical protein